MFYIAYIATMSNNIIIFWEVRKLYVRPTTQCEIFLEHNFIYRSN